MARRTWLLALLSVGLLGGAQAQQAVITVDHGPNAEAQQSKHYVVLVSGSMGRSICWESRRGARASRRG